MTNKERCSRYYYANREKLLKQKRDYYKEHTEEILNINRKWKKENPEKSKESKRKEYYKNKDKYAKRSRDYENDKLKNDPYFKFLHQLRCRIRIAIKKNYKSGSAVKDLGCSSKEAYNYIESLFKDGMSWDNHGEWHIDHIIPLSSFNLKNRDEFLKAVHYTNLQPLWKSENLSKGSKI